MFKVKTYLKKPNMIIKDLSNLDERKNEFFVEINDKDEVSKIKQIVDLQYLEGAIELECYDKIILGLSHWDLVDQLWAYLVRLAEDYIVSGESHIFFPDQPIMLKMKKISLTQILFSVSCKGYEDISVVVLESEFIDFLLTEAENFFLLLRDYFCENYNTDDLILQITRIKQGLSR